MRVRFDNHRSRQSSAVGPYAIVQMPAFRRQQIAS
jgi:hypothetical protein